MACCSSDHYTPLKIVEIFFQEAAEAAKESTFVEISVRGEVEVVTIHKREHALLRNLLIQQEQSPAGKLRVTILFPVTCYYISYSQNSPWLCSSLLNERLPTATDLSRLSHQGSKRLAKCH